MRHMDDVLAGADQNMRDLWAAIALGVGGEREDDDGLVRLASGMPLAMFNPTFVTGPLADHHAAIERTAAFYAERGLPFALYFRDATSPGLADACAAAGLIEHWQPPIMVLDPIPAADPPRPGALMIEVVDADSYGTYIDTLAAGFGMPAELLAPVRDRALLDIPGFTGLLGRVDGEPAVTSGVYVSGAVAGVYNVATVESHRRHGYGEALTAAAARIGAEAGCAQAILQASEAGEPVYRRMGYATPDHYRQFVPAGA